MILKGVSTASETSAKLAQAFLTTKAKKNWARQPQDSSKTLQLMNKNVQDSICNKILQVGAQCAFRFHMLKDLESAQAAKLVPEIVALLYFTGHGDQLGTLLM